MQETEYRGFKVTKVQPITELQCTLRELVHTPTGAKVLHIANEDQENLFCLSFQTRPSSSDGVAHILEHTVLCGSKKFPVKDPFFAMTRRSLNTFMNALTGADFTCYPAASQIPEDFYNLLTVYLDAVFHPLLDELSFRQEGHRLELDQSSNQLQYKGVVFNEMKGSLSSPMTRLSEAVSEALFPNLTYGYNSGGDPKVIPQLTYEQLKDFHRAYYHPSRCLFFFYGNLPLKGHLDFIAEHCLEQADAQPPLAPLPRQPRFQQPVIRQLSYPQDPEAEGEENAYIALAWLTCHILEQEDLLAFSVLDSVLMDTDASLLRMALLKSGLCKQVSSSLDCEISEIPWVIVLRGCAAEDAPQLERIARETLETLVATGIPQNLIESAIHQLEFHRSEITGDSAPFGLSLFWRSALLKQHGGQPEDGLVVHSLFAKLRRRLEKEPGYFLSLIRKYILDNPHFARVVLAPDQDLAALELAQEREQLDGMQARLSPKEREEIVLQTQALARFQEEQESQELTVLPKLTLGDVPPRSRDYPLVQETVGNLQVFRHSCFTNQIVYLDLVYDLPAFTASELPLVRLLTRLFSEMGSGGRDYRKTLELVQEHTGGVDCVLDINQKVADPNAFSPTLHIRGKALYRKGEHLFRLIRDMATSVDLSDRERLKEIILKHYTSLEGGLNSHAMRYALNLSASALGESSRLSSLWYGLEYFNTIRSLAQDFDRNVAGFIDQLEQLRHKLLHLDQGHLVVGCDETYYEGMKQAQFYGLAGLQGRPRDPWRSDLAPQKVPSQARLIASPVAFTAKVFPVVGYKHPDAAPLGLAAHLMENQTLHGRVREKGGAYGAGAVNSPMNGQFYFFAYRDPHIADTLTAFKEAVQEVAEGDFNEEDLEESKLEMVQDLDAPVAPGSRASLAYSWMRAGKTLEVRQGNRDRILAATREDVIRAVNRHVVPNMGQGSAVVFAGRNLVEKENEILVKRDERPLILEKVT